MSESVTSSSPINPPKKTNKTPCATRALTIILLIFVILVGFSGWFFWNSMQRVNNTISSTTQSMQIKITELDQQMTALQTKFNDIQNKLDQLSEINNQSHLLHAFNEANYLIHMGHLQIIINHNVDTALSLLKLANEQLQIIPNSTITPLKESLMNEINELEKAPKLDVAKLLAQLNQISIQVQKLPIVPTTQPQLSTQPKTQAANLPWYKKMGESLSGLKDLVVIRHEEKAIKPLLSDQQLYFLKENVQLKISEAEWAVLYQNQEAYQQSLQTAKQMLQEYYPNPESTTEISNALQSLSEMNIKPLLPDLSDTLKILSQTSLKGQQ